MKEGLDAQRSVNHYRTEKTSNRNKNDKRNLRAKADIASPNKYPDEPLHLNKITHLNSKVRDRTVIHRSGWLVAKNDVDEVSW